eukprot:CAMPEP_0178416212 /NCGR_PEP_ID=MMETSP0689_2-20121128/23948_1 /TAXON_ID=160604 /ORGANISM="Amphidinium massartii, Strain CS-259" /LENGTH=339 /DNA_ID=CAMNT_0020037551 /DNA_START=35 /DNA_END=1050 /DNA_ORIENTATION=-
MGDGEEAERAHFLDVCWSFLEYQKDAAWEVGRWQRAIAALDASDLQLWGVDLGQWMAHVQTRVNENSRFLSLMPCAEICGAPLPDRNIVYNVPPSHAVEPRNSSKVRSTLRQFVRDWAVEGEVERSNTYSPMVAALQKYLPAPALDEDGSFPEDKPKPRVLCPGSGLARLPFELAQRGYAAQGNEFSYHMILGSNLILNTTDEDFIIFPYILNFANRRMKADCMRAVRVPDVCPSDALPEGSELSMAAGEFVEVYKDQKDEWDACATAFFLDTAKNVFLYIRTIANLIRPGGFWVNMGPLLYHYADVAAEISIELSWEEVRVAICEYFDIVEEERKAAG